eukprot:4535776-Pleurochrysis_carterae.AAC.3
MAIRTPQAILIIVRLLTGYSSLRNEFRTSIHRLALVSRCHRRFCASIAAAAAGILARIPL